MGLVIFSYGVRLTWTQSTNYLNETSQPASWKPRLWPDPIRYPLVHLVTWLVSSHNMPFKYANWLLQGGEDI